MKRVCVLGATGSIGRNTLDVIRQHSDKYQVTALSGHANIALLLSQCIEFSPKFVVVSNDQYGEELKTLISESDLSTRVLIGSEYLEYIASHPDVDIVMAAVVGAAGLKANIAAARHGKRVLLANKESLVMSGDLFMQAVRDGGAELLPIDSEHNAIFQSLPDGYRCGNTVGASVSKLLLTASGGPFRTMSHSQLASVTPDQACAHPNWSMGRKISVDSASLMNKGLELIEACWLFNLKPRDIEVVVHPQSVVHSMVSYIDGSVVCQMGQPDMRIPIAYGLAWPDRIQSGAEELCFATLRDLQFEQPNHELFPCLNLASEAFNIGGVAPAFLNAANEVAVDAFLKGKLRFIEIPDIIERVLRGAPTIVADSINTILSADEEARVLARELVTLSGRARAV